MLLQLITAPPASPQSKITQLQLIPQEHCFNLLALTSAGKPGKPPN